MDINIVAKKIEISGIVQGVGMRPFIHKLVKKLSLCGWVRNSSLGAELLLVGEEPAISTFLDRLKNNPPALAFIEDIYIEDVPVPPNIEGFKIIESQKKESIDALVSPDICTCEDCIKELFNPNDRRYEYPFINCTNCGPRFTIIKEIPYDRKNTSMNSFPMCSDCGTEFEDIESRRYHAQPNCCDVCGPRLFFTDSEGKEIYGEAIGLAREELISGKIVAIKGYGGIHLAALPTEECAKELRKRKQREEKPFALMCKSLETAKSFCDIDEAEARILCSSRRPIVLLKKHDENSFKYISENKYLGIMLPYTPLHFLLFQKNIDALIMTSANISDRPIIKDNDEALRGLEGIADYYLLNNRDIVTRCDDSLLAVHNGEEYFFRRSRGYAPYPILFEKSEVDILACGAEQKASFALAKNKHIFLSQHIGDLKNIETLQTYESQVAHFEKLFEIYPKLIVSDFHPDYLSSAYAKGRAKTEKLKLIQVQHHHAHLASCMADNKLNEAVLGLIWDGSGYGEDGKIWGGELLIGDYGSFKRVGSIREVLLAGGDKAIKSAWRVGAHLLMDSGLEPEDFIVAQDFKAVKTMLKNKVNCFDSSGMGRLFDGVAAILDIKREASYEGQGAVLLEAAAEDSKEIYQVDFYDDEGILRFDWRPLVRNIAEDKKNKVRNSLIASKFINTCIEFASEQLEYAKKNIGVDKVVLSGGVFQNFYLMERLPQKLKSMGFKVFTHRRVSTNDEGISLGQIMIGRSRYVSGSTT